MAHIFTRRNVIGTLLIIMAVTLCTASVAFALYRECVTTYTNAMPIYEGAELVESESSLLNYFGLGSLRTVWFIEADAVTVEQWYALTLGDMRRAQREAQRNGEPVLPVWDAEWAVVSVEGGSQVRMESLCF